MWDEILKAFSLVFLPSMLKGILGPLGGYVAGLNIATTIIASVAGMMTSVALVTYAGDWLKKHVFDRFRKKKEVNPVTDAPRKPTYFRRLLARYGLGGVAFFSPLFLTPIAGSIIAVGLGKPKEKILFYMFVSASGWAIIFTLGIYFFLDQIKDWLEYVR
jgi:membrane protein DedA with SNARE-associated domain